MSSKLWATPRSYSFNTSHRPGLTTLDCQVRGLYPQKERYHGVSIDSPQLMLFAEDFPVSRTPLLADVAALKTSATCGQRSPDSFASFDPDGSWRKTCQGYSQVTLDGSLERFSETWPRAGMTRNGTAYRLRPSAPLTDGTESGSWPTPTVADTFGTTASNPRKEANFETKHAVTLAQYVQWRERQMLPTPTVGDSKNARNSTARRFRIPPTGIHAGNTLTDYVTMWPTPRAEHDSGGHRGSLDTLHSAVKAVNPNGQLNPTWVEWLMGYPLGWTVCEAWVTRSSRKSPNGSRGKSSTRKKGA